MDSAVLEKIVDIINRHRNVSKNDLYERLTTREHIDVKLETFTSIYANLKRRQMFKSNDPKSLNWRRLKEQAVNLALRYTELDEQEKREKATVRDEEDNKPESHNNLIIRMASELSTSPVLIARVVLDGMIKMGTLELVPNAPSKIQISQLVKETHLLKNGRLAYEIWECCCVDDEHGPVIDVIRNLVGVEEEAKLESWLISRGIAFVREDELRMRGYDKTPDFKLECPIYLNSGTIVSWIDSKASFCDEQTHKENYENQFKFYLNRFGPGMVIYSYGYVRDVDKMACNFNAGTNKRVIYVCERFPTNYITLDPGSIDDEQI